MKLNLIYFMGINLIFFGIILNARNQQKKCVAQVFLNKKEKNNNCPAASSCINDFRGTNAFYNHFIIDDRVDPGYSWNEMFTSGVR